jgi:hypothetical protein
MIIKTDLLVCIQDKGAINKPTRMEQINRNKLVLGVEIAYLVPARESIL